MLIINRSDSWGGQEQYLATLMDHLPSMVGSPVFEGGPRALTAWFEDLSKAGESVAEPPAVVVLNGNRALYVHAVGPFNASTVIYVQHSSFLDQQAGYFKRIVRQMLLRLALRRVDAVIRVCDAALPAHWKPGAVHTVYNGVDLTKFPLREQWRENSRAPFTMVMVGSVNENKGQRLAIESLPQLPLARLVVVGDGPSQGKLHDLAVQLGVADRVEWAGQQPSPAAYYRRADVCLMLSRFEAMPFVVLESMSSGTPVVACRVGGVPEAIQHEQNGWLLATRSVNDLVGTVRRLIEAPQQVRRMGEEARATVEARFTAQQMAFGFMAVLDHATRRKTGKGLPA